MDGQAELTCNKVIIKKSVYHTHVKRSAALVLDAVGRSGGGGAKPPDPEAERFVVFGRLLETANLSTFLKFGNAKNHRYLCCLCKNEV